MTDKTIHFFIISDSIGETARKVLQAVLAQFPGIEPIIEIHPFIRTKEELVPILNDAKQVKAVIIHTLVLEDLSRYTKDFCDSEQLLCYDILKEIVADLTHLTKEEPTKRAGSLHRLDDEYFNRISAIEFAVRYDDGKDPKGLLEADLVLIGISRTSKTPLSMFLANKNVKVANLPLLPEAQIPDELWQVDPKKIVGLTNDVDTLASFRRERMLSYGMPVETPYTNRKRIKAEVDYALDLYEKIGCSIINVAQRSIEETAEIIIQNVLAEERLI